MELIKIVLVSLSLAGASAIPYGHGVKGGAVARSGAYSGAQAFPGVGGSGGSSSGSFAQSSAASFASSGAGGFSYGTPGGYERLSPSAGQAGSLAAANAVAFAGAGAVAGTGSYGNHPSNDQSSQCGGNCQNTPSLGCQGNNCGSNDDQPDCSSGVCGGSSTPHGDKNIPEKDLPNNQQGPLLGHIALDNDERPGKIEDFDSPKGTNPGHFGSPSGHSSSNVASLCSSPGCGQSPPNEPAPCSTPGCGQYATSGPSCLSSGGCGQSNNNPNSGSPCSSPDGCDLPKSGIPKANSPCSSLGGCSPNNENSNAYDNSAAGAIAGGYGNAPNTVTGSIRTPIINSKPNSPNYSGNFGGPPGIIKPNDYSLPNQQKPSHHQSGPGNSGTPNTSQNNEPSQFLPNISPVQSGSSSHKPDNVPNHHDISGLPLYSGSGAFADAGAHSTPYTGSFGGPPGILRPNDYAVHIHKPGSNSKPIPQDHNKPTHDASSKPSPAPSDSPYQGGFGGAPGIIRPEGYGSDNASPSKPQRPNFSNEPNPPCGSAPGSSCGTNARPAVHPVKQTEKENGPQHTNSPSPSCGANGCGNSNYYPGGYAPSAIRPNEPHDNPSYPISKPQKPSYSHQPNYSNSNPESSPRPVENEAFASQTSHASSSCGPNGCDNNENYQGGSPGGAISNQPYHTQPYPISQAQKPHQSYKPNHSCTPGTSCSNSKPDEDINNIPSSNNYSPSSSCGPNGCGNNYHEGSFEGPSGNDSPNHPTGASYANAHPQKPNYPNNPSYSCGAPGSPCGGSNSRPPLNPTAIFVTQTLHQASSGCGSSGCGDNVQYEGGFGGPPGILSPSGPVSGGYIHLTSSNNYNTPSYYPSQGTPYHGSHSSSPNYGEANSGAFAAAAAGAAAGSYSGHGAPGDSQGNYAGQSGPSPFHSGYGVKGGYGSKNGAHGCDGGCSGGVQGPSGAVASAGAASGAFGFNLNGGTKGLDAVKGIASSFGQLGHDIGKNIGGLLGGAHDGSGNGALSASGSFATASASAGAKSFSSY